MKPLSLACICLLLGPLLEGCAVARVAGAAVSTGVGVAKTTVKAGGAVADGAIDVVDCDNDDECD